MFRLFWIYKHISRANCENRFMEQSIRFCQAVTLALLNTYTPTYLHTHINTHPHPSPSRCIYIVGIERNLISRSCSSKFPPQHLWNYSLQFPFWNGEIGHWTDYLLHKHGDLSLDLGKQKQKKMLMQHHGPLALALGKQKQNHPGFLLGNQSRQNREIKVQRETLSQNIKPRSDSERQHFHLITLSDFYMRLIE